MYPENVWDDNCGLSGSTADFLPPVAGRGTVLAGLPAICGVRGPLEHQTVIHRLQAGHLGWHAGDDGHLGRATDTVLAFEAGFGLLSARFQSTTAAGRTASSTNHPLNARGPKRLRA